MSALGATAVFLAGATTELAVVSLVAGRIAALLMELVFEVLDLVAVVALEVAFLDGATVGLALDAAELALEAALDDGATAELEAELLAGCVAELALEVALELGWVAEDVELDAELVALDDAELLW